MRNAIQIVPSQTPPYQDIHLAVDFARKRVSLDSRLLELGGKEYDLLTVLVRHAGQIVSRQALMVRVWGYSPEARSRTLDVHIRKLRSKLGRYSPQYIETIFGAGYRFQPYQDWHVAAPVFAEAAAAVGA